MFINEPVLKSNKRKPRTMAKNINQYEFTTPRKSQISNQESLQNNTKPPHPKRQIQKQKILNTIVMDQTHSVTQDKGKIYDEGENQFEDTLVQQLHQLLRKWERDLQIIKADLKNFDDVEETQSEIKAFEQCLNLLQAEFNQAEASQEVTANLISKKILQVDDYKKRIIKQIKQTKQENEKLAKQYQMLKEEEKNIAKQQNNRKVVKEKINQEKQKLEKLKTALIECKEKSYEQKNEFVSIQGEQFRIESQLQQLEEEQRKYQQENILIQKYEQLMKIKEKIIISKDCTLQEIRPHLQRKIQKMAKLRSELNKVDEALEVCRTKAEDQNIVIDALRQKSYHEQVNQNEDKPQDLYDVYRKRYTQIYFGEKGEEGSDWKNYNQYLKQLIGRNKNINSRVYTQISKDETKSKMYADSSYQKLQAFMMERNKKAAPPLYKSNYYDADNPIQRKIPKQRVKQGNYSTTFSRNPDKQRVLTQRALTKKDSATITKLPKIIKMQGKYSEGNELKKIVKQGLMRETSKSLYDNQNGTESNSKQPNIKADSKKKISNNPSKSIEDPINDKKKESDFELQSVKSSASHVSGQIIQVQFHKK